MGSRVTLKSNSPFSTDTHLKNIDQLISNLCNPFKYDLHCALFSHLSLLKTKSTPQREAQRRSYLKGLHRLYDGDDPSSVWSKLPIKSKQTNNSPY